MTSLYIKKGMSVLNQPLELLIEEGHITQIGAKLNVQADSTIDLQDDSYISAGWIDDHTHCYEKLSLYYDDPDKDGYTTGVTTVIDAGSTGADNISDFYEITRNKRTNVYAMINISRTGILAQDELADLNKIQFEPLKRKVKDYPDFIVGLKARISKSVVGENGLEPLLLAKRFQKQLDNNLPLMVHVGTNPPELSEIMDKLDRNDIITHCFNGKSNGILDSDGRIKDFVYQGLEKGIIFDIGHGTDSFNFETAKVATEQNIFSKSLSTDIYHANRERGPVYNMATCIEKMLFLGYELRDVIPMITTVPARNFHLKNKGDLRIGKDADITIFDIKDGQKELIDSDGNKRITHQMVKPRYSIIGGQVYSIGE